MKEAGFIPDNISAISNVSRHLFPNPSHEFTELQSDSTDNLIEQILRQRAERLKRQAVPASLAASVEKTQFQHPFKQVTSSQNQNKGKSQQKMEQIQTKQLNSSKLQYQLPEKLINQSKGTIKESSIKQKQSMNKIQVEDNLQVLNNQTNQFSVNQAEQNADKDIVENTNNKFSLPKIDKMSNQPRQHQPFQTSGLQQEQKSLQLNLSLSPSQKKQKEHQIHQSLHKQDEVIQNSVKQINHQQISHNKLNASAHKQEYIKEKSMASIGSEQKQKNKKDSSNHSNHSMHQQIGNGQSHIEVKHSQLESDHGNVNISQQKKGFYDFTPIPQKNQTDMELVKAITQHLNTIQNQQISQRTFRKSEKAVPIVIQPKKQPQLPNILPEQGHKQLLFQQFQTDYSEDHRQIKILEHHYESNLQFQIGQLKQMIQLYEALILAEQCKQTRKQVKQLQLVNRKEKISLRSASYSKRFNFHSPIPKNNDRPIQFRTKFVISPRLKDDYFKLKQNIADEKKKGLQLDEQYQVLRDYYDMMNQKKITVSQQTLKQYEYNSKLQKYETVRNSFYNKTEQSLGQSPNKAQSQYQFNKTKRTIQIQTENIPYYQILKYKVDISKDMILEFQVWNLSKLKKLKDEIIVIKTQLKYVDMQISQIDAEFMKLFGMKSVKSLSKSRFSTPNRVGITDASPKRSLLKSPGRLLTKSNAETIKSQKIILEQPAANGFRSNKTPVKNNLVNKQAQNSSNQLLLIDSVQLDYSKRKAIRILDQMDDYGICPIKQESRIIEDIPTFGKKQNKRLIISPPPNRQSSKSKSKNFVRPRSKQIKTMANLNKSLSSKKIAGKISEKTSPLKTQSQQSQYYISLDDFSSKEK